jgi:hypothetical protein
MKKLLEKFDNATARIETMVLLAGVLVNERLPDPANEFFEDEDFEIIEGCFGPLPEYLKGEIAGGDIEGVPEWLVRSNKLGFLVQFATPIMTPSGNNSASYSWGYYTAKWVYGDTLNAALKAGFAWVKEQRKKERVIEMCGSFRVSRTRG